MIKEIIEKLKRVEERISTDKGKSFNFFGVFKRSDVENSWDIVISANWFSGDEKADLVYIINEIKKDLGSEDLKFVARVVLIKPEDQIIKALNTIIAIEHGEVEMQNTQINGLKLSHIFIITSKK